MSIIVSLFNKKIITMAADSRMSIFHSDGSLSFGNDDSQKLFMIKNNTLGISTCGNAEIMGGTVEEYTKEVLCNVIDLEADMNVIAQSIAIRIPDGIICYVCGFFNGKPLVYRISDGNTRLINYPEENICGLMYDGMKKPLDEKYCNENIPDIESMSEEEMVEYAIDMIHYTCDKLENETNYSTCGGPIDVLVLNANSGKWIYKK